MSIDEFVRELSSWETGDNVFNPYRSYDPDLDIDEQAPQHRAAQLRSYLERRNDARLVLVAEAPGYQGARFTGIAMTCERTLLGHKQGINGKDEICDHPTRTSKICNDQKRTVQNFGYCEPTATVVWRYVGAIGIPPQDFVLWNTFPFHPQGRGGPRHNRRPTRTEVSSTLPLLEAFLELFPGRLIAVGKVASKWLSRFDRVAGSVRHPAHHGAAEFRSGLANIL